MNKITFDISTKSIGVCIIGGGESRTYHIDLNYNENELDKVFYQVSKGITDIISLYRFPFPVFIGHTQTFLLGMEVSNFKNAKITQRFSLIAGIIISIVCSIYKKHKVIVKIFNSNQWQYLIGCKNSDERAVRKQKSKQFYYEKNGVWNDNDDETDAFCMCYYLEQLESTLDKSIGVKILKAKKQSNQRAIAELNKKIITRQNRLLKLKPTQIKTKKKWEREIEEIKANISKLNNR